MYILALDSTATAASVALCDDERLLCCTTLHNGNTHSQTLLPLIENTLAQFSLRPADVGLFACSNGPGSFTGVRIGVSTVKGLAFGRDVPCIGVSTLHALAYNLIGFDGLICPVMNARRNQVYNALFECRDGVLTRLCEDRAIALCDLDAELSARPHCPIYTVGDGYDLAQDALVNSAPALKSTPELLRLQNAYSVAQVALQAYRSGTVTTHTELLPVYLRPCQAERERMERMALESSDQ